jgi:hypothetical protein
VISRLWRKGDGHHHFNEEVSISKPFEMFDTEAIFCPLYSYSLANWPLQASYTITRLRKKKELVFST